MLAMQKMTLLRDANATVPLTNAGKPTMPLGRQPIVERKISDPSSSPKGERYPMPYFYENRIKPREFDPL
jgi:hypothetical protein